MKIVKKINRQLGMWINYRLRLARITHKDIAIQAGLSRIMITYFLSGLRGSNRCAEITASMLGFSSFEELEKEYKQKDGGSMKNIKIDLIEGMDVLFSKVSPETGKGTWIKGQVAKIDEKWIDFYYYREDGTLSPVMWRIEHGCSDQPVIALLIDTQGNLYE